MTDADRARRVLSRYNDCFVERNLGCEENVLLLRLLHVM